MMPDISAITGQYCSEMSSPEPPWLKDVVRYTWLHTTNPRQLSGHLQGRFLSLLSKLLQPDCILEIGTFMGYSALCLAEGLRKNGLVHSVEADGEIAHKAADCISKSPFADKIKIYHADGKEFLKRMEIRPDLIFIDADKAGYKEYFDFCYPLLKPGGLLIFDNTLWSGKVVSSEELAKDRDTENMHAFNQYIQISNPEVVLLPLRDGLTIVRKTS